MKKGIIDDIIIITKHYPYRLLSSPGESFLQNEIPVLCEYAERVHIFCTEVRKSEAKELSLPKNAFSYAVCRKNTAMDKIGCILKGFGYFFGAPDYLKNDRKNKPLKAKIYLHYFCRRGEQKLKRIKDILEREELGQNVMIYSYWCYDHAYAAIKLRDMLGEKHNVRCLSRAHGYDLYEYNHIFKGSQEYIPLRKWLFKNLDAVCPCSDNGRRYLEKRYPAYSDRFITSYIGTRDHGQNAVKCDDTVRICSCSRLAKVKRVDLLIDSLALLVEKGYKLSWIHFGGGKLYNELTEKAKTALKGCEWEIKGEVRNGDIMKFYSDNHVDLFLNVSESEGLPISVMEASSFGIPTVATNVGGVSEIVVDGKTGYLLGKSFSPQEFIGVFEKWYGLSDMEKTDMCKSAREKWAESFEYGKNTKKMISLMEDLF